MCVNKVFVNSLTEVAAVTLLCLRQLGLQLSSGTAFHLTAVKVSQLVSVISGLHLLCWAAVSPGDPYSAAQGAGKAVHSSTQSSSQLLSGGQPLNIATVPHDPACQGQ